jgi:putative SOS response-associated peptidase YedK
MCGRYSLAPKPAQKEALQLDAPLPPDWKPRYNIAPTQASWVLLRDPQPHWESMGWGLVPAWSRDARDAGKRINARAETALEKPSFRDALLQRRCAVPADSFYEWRKEPDGRKLPYRILAADEGLLWMAGIWEMWGGQRRFSILTTAPNREMAMLHDRMPLLLPSAAARAQWLSPAHPGAALADMLQPPPDGLLRWYRVSESLNAIAHDAPDLHAEVPDVWRLF